MGGTVELTTSRNPGWGRPLRVLHCRAPQTFGGPDRQILALMERAREIGVEQDYLVIGRSGQGAAKNVLEEGRRRGLSVLAVQSHYRLDIRPFNALRRAVCNRNVDVICTHGYLPDFLGRGVARLTGRPIVAVSRGFTLRTRSIRIYEWLDRRTLRGFDHVVTVSEALRQHLVQSGIPPERVTTIHNSVGQVRPLSRHEARGLLGLRPDVHVIGSAGRLSPEKGHRILLEAAALILREGTRIELVICGDGPEMPSLVTQRAKLGIEQEVLLAGWRTDVEQILSAFDTFVLPSFTEGMPNALLEAQAAGIPTVASAVGGVPELMRDGETGVLVPAGDSRALAAALLALYRDPARARSMAEAARARVSEQFSRVAQAERYRQVFEAVVLKRNGISTSFERSRYDTKETIAR